MKRSTQRRLRFSLVLACLASLAFGVSSLVWPMLPSNVVLATSEEVQNLQGGLVCMPITYVDVPYVMGCGGPSKGGAICAAMPEVLGPWFAPLREWTFKDCKECGITCGSQQWIIPTSCY